MKKIIYIFLLYFFAAAVLPSCKNVQNEPRDLNTLPLIFDPQDLNATLAQQFLNNIYNYLPAGFNRIGGDFLDAASGDAVSSLSNTSISYYNNGIVSSTTNPDPYFSNSYNGIRQVNIFLANIDKVPVPPTNLTRTITWKAEARFIRAFLYFELLKRYGGVPLIGDKIFSLDDNLQLSRNTYADCVSYIVSECDAIKGQLNLEPISAATNLGRIPRGAAVALKCRVYLYAASPLFNGGGIEGDATLKALTGYLTYDASRWQNVISAAQELIALNAYSLVQSGTTGYVNIFFQKQNTEVILAKQQINDFALETADSPVGYAVNNVQSAGRTSPTQEFVDAFSTINGLPITDPASGYNPLAPYTNRDPRLNAIVFYNGSLWLNRPGGVQTFDGGLDRPNMPSANQTRTGYYLRKFLADNSTSSSYSAQSHNFVYFRYAEVLLNYAEALNEAGRTEDAVTQLVLLRKRAGLQAGTAARYGIPGGISQTDLRTLIQQNDRRIELSFEEHRFWDLRRWKIANTELNKTLHGMQITKNSNGTFTYQVVPVTTIVFQDKLYHMPIPYTETVTDANLKQNSGW
ncbi:MAG TPA: RagB/SusD family nutrient uptake outer membrane protein [Mucilaginibacter sp.]|nr:RagB/SusD family nutrient uptake outer membrane protein [Mucilaginibacter sp.]